MKIYETPSIELVKYETIDIVTTSKTNFDYDSWLDPLSLG